MSDRFGGFIVTYTGRRIFPLDPRPDEVHVSDIGQGLSLRCRWTGQCSRFYSIATHSVRVAKVALAICKNQDPAFRRLLYIVALLHDSAEAYLADVASPVKRHLRDWAEIEDRMQTAIHQHFGLDDHYPDLKPIVKAADYILLWIEHQELFNPVMEIDDFFGGQSGLWPGFPDLPPEAITAASIDSVSREMFESEVESALSALHCVQA